MEVILKDSCDSIPELSDALQVGFPFERKWFRMTKSRFAKQVIAVSGFLLLVVAPAFTETQSTPPSPAQNPHMAPQVTRPGSAARPDDDLQGITLTDDQQAKIDQIHRDMESRMDVVVKDPAENEDQKGAMLQGLARLERRQVFDVLTLEQQAKVRKRILASRAAEQEKNKKQTALPPK